jgi:Holliday junction resolvase-like predicted endonuclease
LKPTFSPEGSLPDFPEAFNLVSNPTLDLPFPTNGTTSSVVSPCNESTPSQSLCKRCNALFTRRSSWQLYCTGACRTAACRANNESDALVSIRVRQQANEIERAQTDARVALRKQTKIERDANKAIQKRNHQTFLKVARECVNKNKELTKTLTQDIKVSNATILSEYQTRAEDTFDAGVLGIAIAATDRQDRP